MLDENKDNLNREETTENDLIPEANLPEKVAEQEDVIVDSERSKEVSIADAIVTEKENSIDNVIEEVKEESESEDSKLKNEVAQETKEEKVIEEKVEEKVIEEKVEEKIAEEKVEEKVIEEKVEEKIAEEKVEEKVIEEKVEEKIAEEKVEEKIEEKVEEKVAEEKVEEKIEEKVIEGKVEEKVVKEKVEEKIVEEKDYESFNLEQLVDEFKKLIQEESIPLIKNNVEKVKQSFNQKFKALLEEKKKIFIKEGGNEIDFHYSDPIKSAFNDLVFEFKTKRERFYIQIGQEQKENLAKRLELIEELKYLIDHAEASTMYHQFQELQKRWRVIGRIPRTKYNDVWRTYHHHVERFYDLLHLNKDFRDLDFKHNYEEKLKLVEKVEKLAENEDLNYAFKELQVLHRMWKEEIGPVAREFREEIWERFSNATKIIHDKRHEFQKELEAKYEENIVKKRAVIEKIANLYSESISSHNIWQQKIKELNAYREEFFKLGRVPKKVSNQIWNEFKEATRNFNKAKNQFYKNIKRDQHDNLVKKQALVEKAESLKNSEDFDATTEIMKQIQTEWKTIGHVPRKFSDKIWKQFKDACNHYFDRLHGNQDEANKEQLEVFAKKKELLEGLKSQIGDEKDISLDLINSYIDDWHKLGRLHGNMRHVDTKFNKTINALYAKLDLDEHEVALLKFKNIITNHLEANDYKKLDNEQLFIRKKIDELSREIQQLENNIGFISNASEDNPLLKNVRANIQKYNDERDVWKEKLSYLVNLNY